MTDTAPEFDKKKQYTVLAMNTTAFAVNFMVWTMFSVIGIKIKAYAMAVWAGMGPRHGFRGSITDPRTGRQIIADPVKYAHLVERGTAPHGKHPGSPPRAFMRKAFEAHRESAARAFAEGVVKDIEAAWDKILTAQGAAA
ncbi:hypothetical protein LCGC14_2349110 [marine sediment metagenome]|uniref:Uncharacterized protein n=1 Tax=marine sediment metagenome TaxID=412755 RepID=A0A0F9F4S2_9ZZZZ